MLLALLLAACGSGDRVDVARDTGGAEPRAVEIAALDPSALPTDPEVALDVLGDLPEEVAGMRRSPAEAQGQVHYGARGQLVVAVMEASDMGVSEETNAELLAIEAQRPGRTVTAQETDRSAPLLYVTGTEGVPPVHFLLWTTPDNPLIFAVGADSAEHLEALVLAFREAAT